MHSFIDKFLPAYDFTEHLEILINAPAERVFQCVRSLDARESKVIRFLMESRGMSPDSLTLEGILKEGFILLGENPNQELLLGVVGRFWTMSGCLEKLDPDMFTSFNKPGYAKAVWNFFLTPVKDGKTLLSTDTRIQCLGKSSKKYFQMYWFFVKPFSGWIRKEMLSGIKRDAEKR